MSEKKKKKTCFNFLSHMWQTSATRDKLAIWITVSQRYRAQKSMTISLGRQTMALSVGPVLIATWGKAGCTLPNPKDRISIERHLNMKEMKKDLRTSCVLMSPHLCLFPSLTPSSSSLFRSRSFLSGVLVLFCLGQGLWKVEHLLSHQNCVLSRRLHTFLMSYFLHLLIRKHSLLKEERVMKTPMTLGMKDCSMAQSSFVRIKFNPARFNIQLDAV